MKKIVFFVIWFVFLVSGNFVFASGDDVTNKIFIIGANESTPYSIRKAGSTMRGTNTYTQVNLGISSTTSGDRTTVSGGFWNEAIGYCSTVSGGRNNTASAMDSTVSGGHHNTASGWRSTVSGGWNNIASGNLSNVGGGYENVASGEYSSIGNGYKNTVVANYSSIGNGLWNKVYGDASCVLLGRRIKISDTADHTFVWGWNGENADYQIDMPNAFLIFPNYSGNNTGRVGIGTKAPSEKMEVAGNVKANYFKGNGSYLTNINTTSLSNFSITNEKIADNAVTSGKVLDGTISTNDLANSLITNAKLAADAVTSGKITNGTISTDDLANSLITNAKLAASAVTSAKISNGTIINEDLAEGSFSKIREVGNLYKLAVETNALYVDGGKVGIGTTALNAKLEVAGTIKAEKINIGSENTVTGIQASVAGGFQNSANGKYAFVAGGNLNNAGAERSFAGGKNTNLSADAVNTFAWSNGPASPAVIDMENAFLIFPYTSSSTTGKVGIGVSNPSTKLEVAGAVSANVYYGDGSNLKGISTGKWEGTGDIYYNDGGVSVGTNSSVGRLLVIDKGSLGDDISGNKDLAGLIVQNGDNTHYLAFDANQIEAVGSDLYINNGSNTNVIIANGGGNVVIGKPSAATALDVNGIVTATSFSGSLAGSNITGKVAFSNLNILKTDITSLGIPDAKLTPAEVDSYVANNGYLTTVINDNVAANAAIDFSKLNITKANITGLGIPAQDTNTTYANGAGLNLDTNTFSINNQ
ncbi:hypothetical protein ACFL2K_05295, partial [Candidatus Margulisiibacteriota bacterium]